MNVHMALTSTSAFLCRLCVAVGMHWLADVLLLFLPLCSSACLLCTHSLMHTHSLSHSVSHSLTQTGGDGVCCC